MASGGTFDVVVVGAGPGGSMAAKKCAEQGFRTLIVEKRRLPRDKVCTGMIMAPWCRELITSEFGGIPQEVLTTPYRLEGHRIHVPGAPPALIACPTPIAWRKDLDYWMTGQAVKRGAVIREGAKAVGLQEDQGSCILHVKTGHGLARIRARFVIGADGGASAIRKLLFPELRVEYSAPLREFHLGKLDIEPGTAHWFFPRAAARPRFDLVHKGDGFVLEGSGLRELKEEIPGVLAEYGFERGRRPLWRDGCLVPLLHHDLISGALAPARGNVLLVGDAAGLILPVTFEGIGTALLSGLSAAGALACSAESGKTAAASYLESLGPILRFIERLHKLNEEIRQAAEEGAYALSAALKKSYEVAMESPES